MKMVDHLACNTQIVESKQMTIDSRGGSWLVHVSQLDTDDSKSSKRKKLTNK